CTGRARSSAVVGDTMRLSLFCVPSVMSLSSALVVFSNHPAPTELYTLSLHDALPICRAGLDGRGHGLAHVGRRASAVRAVSNVRSEEHTSELQSPDHLVCRLLLEKKNNEYGVTLICTQ